MTACGERDSCREAQIKEFEFNSTVGAENDVEHLGRGRGHRRFRSEHSINTHVSLRGCCV